MEKSQKNRSPQHDSGGMLAQIQTSAEVLSPVPLCGKCGKKDYERLFIRESEVKAREGKIAYIHPEYHNRIVYITRVTGHDRLLLSAYIGHVLTRHFNQCEEAIKNLCARNYDTVFWPSERRTCTSKTINMTDILLTVSVGYNLWFLFLFLYDRIMEARPVRFLRSIAGVWRSLGGTAAKPEAVRKIPPADTPNIISKSRFRMASTRTTVVIPTQEATTPEKNIELTEEEATFGDGSTETVSRPAQIPEDKLDETFTSLTPSELRFGEGGPEEETPNAPRASGSSFDEIDDAVGIAKSPEATTTEWEQATKVFTDMEGTELYEKPMTGSSEISIRIRGLIEIQLKRPKEDSVVPDNIEDFNIHNYV